MGIIFVGWILIVIGLFFLLLGLAAAIKNILQEKSRSDSAESSLYDPSIIKVLIELINALGKAPQWLALTVVGLILIIIGSSWSF